jgi:hypothetical protein
MKELYYFFIIIFSNSAPCPRWLFGKNCSDKVAVYDRINVKPVAENQFV